MTTNTKTAKAWLKRINDAQTLTDLLAVTKTVVEEMLTEKHHDRFDSQHDVMAIKEAVLTHPQNTEKQGGELFQEALSTIGKIDNFSFMK